MVEAVAREVVKALEDSGRFSEVELNTVVGVGVIGPDTVYAYDDTHGVSVRVTVKCK